MISTVPFRRFSWFGGLVVAVFFVLGVAANSAAQQQIKLQGKDTSWRQVGTVEAWIPFQIEAHGMVDFGGIGNDDGVTAGVTGNAFAKWCSDNWKDIVDAIEWLVITLAGGDDSGGSSDGKPGGESHAGHVFTTKSERAEHEWNWVKFIEANGKIVNYDEGGFWVAITKNDQPPSADNLVCFPALYYWYAQLYNQNVNVAYDQKVFVWVRQHDGGRDPFGPKLQDYEDNTKFYTIQLNLDRSLRSPDAKGDAPGGRTLRGTTPHPPLKG